MIRSASMRSESLRGPISAEGSADLVQLRRIVPLGQQILRENRVLDRIARHDRFPLGRHRPGRFGCIETIGQNLTQRSHDSSWEMMRNVKLTRTKQYANIWRKSMGGWVELANTCRVFA